MRPTTIELSGLYKRFGDTTAVEEVSLEIEDGEFFTLLGPSGSGKTTLLRMIAGLETPTDGAIYLGGADVTDDRPSERDVSTVFQNYALFPHMTVSENIAYGLEIREHSSEAVSSRVDEMLDLVNLPDVDDRYPDSLSGGQQQRVALSRALAIEPEVLLLDEPLGALDEKLRQEMQVKLKEIQREVGTTFLYVTHDQEEALTMSDRLAVMNDGHIVQRGDPKEVYNQPRTEFVARFFRGSNIFSGPVVDTNGTGIDIRFASSTIAAATDDVTTSPGDTVNYFVRSNNVEMDGTHPNRLDGTVVDALYHGATVEYHVAVGEETVSVLSTDDSYATSEDVQISWSADDTIVLEQAATGTEVERDTEPIEA